MSEKITNFEVQASHKCIELFGWDELWELAYSFNFTEEDFYPWKWWFGTTEERALAPQKVEVTIMEIKGTKVIILPYIDKNGIYVISFDPSSELHHVKDGQHRTKI